MPVESMEMDVDGDEVVASVTSTPLKKNAFPTHTASEIKAYEDLLNKKVVAGQTFTISEQTKIEKAIYALSQQYSHDNDGSKLDALVKSSRPFIQHLSKAKAGKLVRTIVGEYLEMPSVILNPAAAVALCKDSIEWCKNEKRTFLRQAIETRLVRLYLDTKSYDAALAIVENLAKELKKLDDKSMLVEVNLLESRALHKLGNLSRSRSALTTARTAANAIYCPPQLQGDLDFQSGILHIEEGDFKTSYSYFYETFECFDAFDPVQAILSLQYMLLCKILQGQPQDVTTIMNGKLSLKYSGRQIEVMQEIASAQKNRSLKEFKAVLLKYNSELSGDPVIEHHLNDLYQTLLEENLCRLIEPFSRVEIAHIAQLISLPEKSVEEKLSKMILDKKIIGILDQGAGCLIIYQQEQTDKVYEKTLETLHQMNTVIDSLYVRARKLK